MVELLLGVNNCFAVKRWPEPDRWAQIISADLDLEQVQLSRGLLDPLLPGDALSEQEALLRDAIRDHGLKVETTFTGLNAYNQNLLSHPNEAMRFAAEQWFEAAIRFTARLGS